LFPNRRPEARRGQPPDLLGRRDGSLSLRRSDSDPRCAGLGRAVRLWRVEMQRSSYGACDRDAARYSVDIRIGTMRYIADAGDTAPEFTPECLAEWLGCCLGSLRAHRGRPVVFISFSETTLRCNEIAAAVPTGPLADDCSVEASSQLRVQRPYSVAIRVPRPPFSNRLR
jgi:hypothetical protein